MNDHQPFNQSRGLDSVIDDLRQQLDENPNIDLQAWRSFLVDNRDRLHPSDPLRQRVEAYLTTVESQLEDNI